MKFTKERKEYHSKVLQEVARMLGRPVESAKKVTPVETHSWAAAKVRQLVKL